MSRLTGSGSGSAFFSGSRLGSRLVKNFRLRLTIWARLEPTEPEE